MYIPRPGLLPTFLRELFSPRTLQREPESSLVMEDSDEVKAYVEGGQSNALAATYLFLNSHASQVLHGCRSVVDLGCGPATLLCQIAAANPSIAFVGVDLSATMIAAGEENIRQFGVTNVSLMQGDITRLESIADQSFDGVMTSFALHHLPSYGHLEACFNEMSRILAPGGRVFIDDFTRLKSIKSVISMAYFNSEDDPYLFTLDKERSMRAAFTFDELKSLAHKAFPENIEVFATFKVPLLTIIRTRPGNRAPASLEEYFQRARTQLPEQYRHNLDDLRFFFYLNGMSNDLFGTFVPLYGQMAKLRMMDFSTLPVLHQLHCSHLRRLGSVMKMMAKASFAYSNYRLADLYTPQAHEKHREVYARKLADCFVSELGALKGPLMKFGQIISYLPGDAPPEIYKALSTLQSRSAPYESAHIRNVVEQELRQPIDKIFKEWHDTPIAAASISQLHLARLHNDRLVIVKVRYPKILRAVKTDFSILRLFSPVLKRHWGLQNIGELIDELEDLITSECDFIKAANFQEEFRQIFSDDPQILIPQVYTDYSTAAVLTMDYVEGQSYEEFKNSSTQEQKNKAGEIIWRMAAVAINRYGIYNADPHPGNYLFVKDKVAFVDFGFTRRFSTVFIDLWKQQSLAGCAGDYERVVEINRHMGYEFPGKKFDHRIMYDIYRDIIYQSWRFDRTFRFDKPFVHAEQMALIQLCQSAKRTLRMPREFVAILRLLWGQHALLADLNAEANWHRIVFPLLEEASDPTLFDASKRQKALATVGLEKERHA
ncbi:AarF/UbiB family protein [Propionivibrio sp.]|uniref:AarF/UbiB family protein n=1 Tax=Propionivibrio sp. TaxID=2212460 RepID=UPI002631A3C5|nr:AarF/UbiB family protein [Propionivibrio sp.]